MKNLFYTLVVIAVLMNLAAPKIKAMMTAHSKWRVDVAVQQVEEAKRAYAEANADNQNALDTYNSATAEERKLALQDAGLLNEKACLYVADPGSLDETATGHTGTEMERVAHESRSGLGTALASL